MPRRLTYLVSYEVENDVVMDDAVYFTLGSLSDWKSLSLTRREKTKNCYSFVCLFETPVDVVTHPAH